MIPLSENLSTNTENEILLSTKEASDLSGYHSDYLARLCRSGKIQGKQIGRTWVVSKSSLLKFVTSQEERKIELRTNLSEQREKEYKKHIAFSKRPIARTIHKISPTLLRADRDLSKSLQGATQFQKHATAVLAALVFMLVAVSSAQVVSQKSVRQELMADALDTSVGLRELLAVNLLPHASVSNFTSTTLQTPLEKFFTNRNNFTYSYVPAINSKLVTSTLPQQGNTFSSRYISQENVVAALTAQHQNVVVLQGVPLYEYAMNVARAELAGVVHPLQTVTALIQSTEQVYVALGASIYKSIDTLQTTYIASINTGGAIALGIGTGVRDASSIIPRTIAQNEVNAVVGLVTFSNAIVHGYENAIYAWVDVTPTIPVYVAKAMLDTGTYIADATATITPTIVTGYEIALQDQVQSTLRVLASENVQTRSLSQFALGTTNSILAIENDGMTQLGQKTQPIINSVAVSTLPAFGLHTISAHVAGTSQSLVASVHAALAHNLGEQVAISTYDTINSASQQAFNFVTGLLGIQHSSLAVIPNTLVIGAPSVVGPVTSPRPAASSNSSVTGDHTSSQVQNVNIYQNNVQGVSQNYVDTAIQDLRNFVLAQNDVTVRTRSGFSGGSTSNNGGTGALSATTLDVSSTSTFSGPVTIAGNVTILGTLTAPGFTGGAVPFSGSYPFFAATSTSDTSTFAGNVNIDNGGFVYATSTQTTSMLNSSTTNASATNLIASNAFINSLSLGSLNGFLKATAGVVSTSSINLASDIIGTLAVANGGTGSTTLSGLLKGNGTGGLLSAIAGVDYQPAGAYLTLSSLSATTPLAYDNTTGIFSLQQAGLAQDGYLSSLDFNTFNNKISSTSLSAGTGIAYDPATGVISNTGVTSVDASGGTTGLTFSGGPVTTTGILTLGGTLAVANGGTGSTTPTGLLLGDGLGGIQTAVPGTDYIDPATYNSLFLPALTANIGSLTTDYLPEGSTNLYYTDARAVAAPLTGYIPGMLVLGSITPTDSILTAMQKLESYNMVFPQIPHTFSALQQFYGNASTTDLSANTASFGATATSSFASDGTLTLASALTVPNGGTGSTTLSGLLKGNGTGGIATAKSGIDYLVPASLSANLPLLYSSGILNITRASRGIDGYLTRQDFASFDNKVSSTSLSAGTGIAYNPATGIISNTGVTSVGASGGTTGLTFSGGPVTTTGTLTLSGTLGAANGGTGISSYTPGEVLYANALGNLTALPAGSNGLVLKMNGGVPSWQVDLTVGSGGTDGIFATSSNLIYPINSGNVLVVGGSSQLNPLSIFEAHGMSYFSGNVGIGSTSPLYALSVEGNSSLGNTATAGTFIATSTLSASVFPYASTTAITIGNLNGLLQANNGFVSAIATSSLGLLTTNVAEGTNLYFTNARAINSTLTGYTSAPGTISSSDSIIGAIQKLDGNVGALVTGVSSVANSDGTLTISPTTGSVVASLNLAHANTFTALQQFNGNASTTELTTTGNTYLATLGGNVGIGTSAPVATLDVNGFINTSQYAGYMQNGRLLAYASSTNGDLIFGLGAGGQNATTSAATGFNTAIGINALNANTTGINNVALGTWALIKNTTGSRNTAIGTQTLQANTTGITNTAIGTYALAGNTTGVENVSVGAYTLVHNTTGIDNTANGTYSLQSNTTGNFNTATGLSALTTNTTGFQNTANGIYTLNYNTTGSSNNAFGYQSLYNNTTGSSNNAFGSGALYSNTTGQSNTALGYQSGYDISTGYDNLLLGTTDTTGGGITTGANNIGIGFNAGVFPSATANNQLNIGNSIFGTISATTSATTLASTFPSVRIGIATSSPYATLSVGMSSTSPSFVIGTAGSSTPAFMVSSANANGYVGIGTSTPGSLLSIGNTNGINFGTATSTFNTTGGVNLASGCYAIGGTCIATGVSSVTNSDGTLTISPGTGAVVASLNLASPNTFTALQQFNGNASTTQLTTTGNTYLAASGGNVGIGTTSPGSLFSINNVANFGVGTSTIYSGLVLQGGNLSVLATTSTLVGTSAGGLIFQPNYLTVSGKYLYIASQNSPNAVDIVDVSNPTSPTQIGSAPVASNPFDVAVAGRYMYVTSRSGNALVIYDVSNPTSPIQMSTIGTGLSTPEFVKVSGKYAYVSSLGTSSLVIFDISNPSAPVQVSTTSTGLSNIRNFDISGHYAYVSSQGNASIVIYDIANPAAPIKVGSSSTGLSNPYDVSVSGRYAYVADTTNGLIIFDISNPASPTKVGSSSTGLSFAANLTVSGRYVYLASYGNNSFVTYDVANPATPVVVSSVTRSLTGPVGVAVAGRYVYVSQQSANSLGIYDIGGSEQNSAIIHSLEAGNIQVRNNITAQGQLQVNGGISVGAGGIFSSGPLSVSVATTSIANAVSATFQGFVGVGTTTPWGMLSINPNGIGAGLPEFVIGSSTATHFLVAQSGFVGIGTTTPGSLLSIGSTNGINFSTATSTFSSTGGINLASGCFAINGVCTGNGSVTNVATDATLTGGPITSTGTLGLNLAHPNTFTALQQFNGNASTTNLSANIASFGTTATSSFASNGALTLATALTVPNGGTGALTFTAGGLLKGNGIGPIQTAVAGTDYISPLTFGPSFYNFFHATTTDALAEGSTNLYFTNARAINSTLTGYTSGTGTISPSDTVLSAIQKLNGNIGSIVSGVSSVTNSDSSLTISPGTGAVVASLNLANPNTFTALQQFNGNASTTQLTTTGNTYLAATGGYVGINSTAPAYPLDINATGITAQFGDSNTSTSFISMAGGNSYMGYNNSNANTVIQSTGHNIDFDVNSSIFGGNVVARITSAGNFGIGTTSPYALLSVGGNAAINGNEVVNGTVTLPALATPAGSFLAVDANGNMVATSSPATTVSNIDGTLTIAPTSGNVLASLNLAHPNTFTALQQFNGNASTTQLTTTGNTYLATTGGLVGIGTTSPSAALSINTPIGMTTQNTAPLFVIGSTTTSTGANNTLFSVAQQSTGAVTVSMGGAGGNNSFSSTNSLFFGIGTLTKMGLAPAVTSFVQSAAGSSVAAAGGHFTFTTGAGLDGVGYLTDYPVTVFNNTVQRTRASGPLAMINDIKILPSIEGYTTGTTTGNANVTIASTTSLYIAGTPTGGNFANITNTYGLFIGATTTETASTTNSYGLAVQANAGATNNYAAEFLNGNVGVGTTSPYALLSIDANGSGLPLASPVAVIKQQTSGTGDLLDIIMSNGGKKVYIDQNGQLWLGILQGASGTFTANTNGTTALAIQSLSGGGQTANIMTVGQNGLGTFDVFDPHGNLGVGTTTPWATLSVSTSTQSNGSLPLFAVASSTNATLFNVLGNGNVGIGTTSPFASLSIDTVGQSGAQQNTLFAVGSTTQSTGLSTTLFSVVNSTSGTTLNINGPTSNANRITSNNSILFTTTGISTLTLAGSQTSFGIGNFFASPNASTGHYAFNGTPDTLMPGYLADYPVFNIAAGQLRQRLSSPLAMINDFKITPSIEDYTTGSTTLAFNTIASSTSLYIAGTPTPGPRANISNVYGLFIDATSSLTAASTTNSYGIAVKANTGATNNYAAEFLNGSVGVGTTSPWRTLSLSGTLALSGITSGSTGNTLCLTAGGEVTSGASCTVSSQRFKHDITPLSETAGLGEVLALQPVSFVYNQGYGDNGAATQVGFVAEQAQQIDPRLVPIDSSGLPGGFFYQNYTAILTKAIQQLEGGYSLNNLSSHATSTIASMYAGVAAPAISVDSTGNVGIGNSAPTSKLSINGTVTASAYVVPGAGQNFANTYSSLVLGSTTATSALTADGTGVDLFKLGMYTMSGVQQLAVQTNTLASTTVSLSDKLVALTTRVSALEAGAAAATASLQSASSTAQSGLLASTTSVLAGAFQSFGVLLQNGVAQFDTLVVRDLVFSKDTSGASAAGSGKILAGNTTVQITNQHMLAQSQVSVTLTSPMSGSWYVTNKKDGSFQVTLSGVQGTDVTFDYLIVQTQGQVATSTPDTAGNPFSWLVNFLAPTTTATQTTPVTSATTPAPIESGTGTATGVASSTLNTSGVVVTLKGSAAISLTQGMLFMDPGASAVDASGTDITSSIVVTGTVDTNTSGMYTLTYTATDAKGGTGNVSRVVTVSGSVIPAASSGGSSTTPSAPAAPSTPVAPTTPVATPTPTPTPAPATPVVTPPTPTPSAPAAPSTPVAPTAPATPPATTSTTPTPAPATPASSPAAPVVVAPTASATT